jgi:hypothetical protein
MTKMMKFGVVTGLLVSFCGLALGQQVNPNKLPACPKSDWLKFHNCWGTYGSYTGEFQNDKFNGIGSESPARMSVLKNFPNGLDEGSWFYGEWKDGLSHGKGLLVYSSGQRIEGVWESGKFVREENFGLVGITTSKKKDTQKQYSRDDCEALADVPAALQRKAGECENEKHGDSKLDGYDTQKYPNGDVYYGEIRQGKRNGHGTYIAANGDKYVGQFKAGNYHGPGIYTTADGREFEGVWENSKLVRAEKINHPNRATDAAINAERSNIENERQQLAEERRRLEEDKRQREQQRRSQRLNLMVTNTQPATDGSFTIDIQTNADTASLKINGNEEGGRQDGRYSIKLVARAGQKTDISIVVTDINGNTDSKIITVNREIVDPKITFAALNPAQVKRQADRDAVAIIIGIADYKSLPKADFANDDARVFYDYAIRALGIKPENIKLLVDTDADEVTILKAFRTWLPSKVRSSTDVYVYYSGHGYPAESGTGLYLLPQRADREFIARTSIQLQEINADLQAAKPKSVTIFMDACYSGQARNGETLVASARPIVPKVDKKLFPDNFTVITASQADQWSSSSPELKHGIFSYYLMKGMEGEADANKDGRITLGEMQAYLVENVGRQAGMMSRKQEPQLIGDARRVLVGR